MAPETETHEPETPARDFATTLLNLREPPRLPTTDEGATERGAFLQGEFARSLDRQRGAVSTAQEKLAEQTKGADALTAKQSSERQAADPGTLRLQPSPTGEARPFAAPGPNASLLTQLNAVLLGVGTMAFQISGLKGSALPAAAALKGVMQGWAAGDQERVRNEYKAWQANSDKLIEEHRAATDKYRRLFQDHELSWAQKSTQWAAEMKGLEWTAARHAIETGQIEAAIKAHDLAVARGQKLAEDRDKLQQQMLQHELDREQRLAIAAMVSGDRKSHDETLRAIAALHTQGQLDKPAPGGPRVNAKTLEIGEPTMREFTEGGGLRTFKPISKQQMDTVKLLTGEAMPQIDQLELLGDKILARHPGQNLAKLVELSVQGKLSDSDVREYGQARVALDFTLSRAFGGSSAVRQFIFKQLDASEVATLGDTKQTMRRMAENSRTAVINYIRSAKSQPPFPMPAAPRTVEAVKDDGTVVQIKLAPYEPLPAGFRYRF